MTESSDTPEHQPSGEPAAGDAAEPPRVPSSPPPAGGVAPPPYPYPPAPYPGGAPPYPAAPKNGLGIAALVIAIVALLTSFTVVGGIVLGIAAVVFGFLGRARVRRGEADNGGVATTGIVLGFLAIATGVIFIVVWIMFWTNMWHTVGGDDYLDCLRRAGSDQASQQQCAEQFNENVEDRFGVTITPAIPTP